MLCAGYFIIFCILDYTTILQIAAIRDKQNEQRQKTASEINIHKHYATVTIKIKNNNTIFLKFSTAKQYVYSYVNLPIMRKRYYGISKIFVSQDYVAVEE